MLSYYLNLAKSFGIEVLFVTVAAALIPFVISLFLKSAQDSRIKGFVILYAISILALVIGQVTAQSREPAVAAVLPAVLTLIGGIAIYLLAAKDQQQQILAGTLVILFTVHLLGGMFLGREFRKTESSVNNQYRKIMDREIAQNKAALDALDLELFLRKERKLRGLPTLEEMAEESGKD